MNTSQSSRSSYQVERVCITCSREFIQYQGGAAQRSCPSCLDLIQRRPTIVLKREVLQYLPAVLIDTLAGPWAFIPPFLPTRDIGHFRIDIKGSSLGGEASWSGRIVIRSNHPYTRNSIASVRIMRSIHLDRLTGKRRDREYMVLGDPKERPPHLPALIYITLDLSVESVIDRSIWSRHIYSGKSTVNGNSFTDEGVLALIDRKNNLVIETKDNSGRYTLPEE